MQVLLVCAASSACGGHNSLIRKRESGLSRVWVKTMIQFLEKVTTINKAVNSFLWNYGVVLLFGTGILMTLLTGVFQIVHLPHWVKKTIGGMFAKESHDKSDKSSISQFQALCTALSATIGTGNIAGVASAICVGGAGAVFWMWVAAFFGMMTNYSENVLGIFFRRKNSANEWSGGAMYYLQDGLGGYKHCKKLGRVLAAIFACFAILASFGIGNMGQVNKIVDNMEKAFFDVLKLPKLYGNVTIASILLGLVLMLVGSLVIVGGLKRVASFAEAVVPFMALAYVIGSLFIIICNAPRIPEAFLSIFKCAFGIKAVAGGAAGVAIKTVIEQGCKRGVFSNEAGLGSSVMVHSNSNVKEPVKQGMWGIFEVFADTFVVCTMTALVVLTSNYIDLSTGMAKEGVKDSTLVADAFADGFGRFGSVFAPVGRGFIAIAILLFAFTTVLGWSHYGSKSVEYLFGIKAAKIYRIIFSICIVSGALLTSSLAWDISDTFNALMMVPNLIGVIALSPLVARLTKNYVKRKLKGQDIEPMVSYDPEIQKAHAEEIKHGAE